MVSGSSRPLGTDLVPRALGTGHMAASLRAWEMRASTVAWTANLLKPQSAMLAQAHVFQLARRGPGCVTGSISAFVGQNIPGMFTVLTSC